MSITCRLLLVFLACTVLVWPSPCLAQEADSVYVVGEITVTASRIGTPVNRAAQRVSVLEADAIQSTASRTLADLLSARSTLFIRRQGQGLATVSQRGAGPSQTQFLIDGMRLGDPMLGQFDANLLPTHLFESVEILHGPGSALYGSDGMSGIVHLRTRRGEDRRLSLLTEAGAYGERLASAGYSFESSGVAGLATAEIVRADGDFPFMNQTAFPPKEVRRQNADRERRSLFGTLHGRLGVHRLRGALLYADASQGIPGVSGAAPQGERRWDEHVRFWIEDRIGLSSGTLHFRSFVHHGLLRYQHPGLEIDDTGRTLTGGLEGEYRGTAAPNVEVSTGASVGYGAATHPSLSASADELHMALFSGATGTIGPARIYPALRLDVHRLDEGTRSAVSPRLGANVRASRHLPLFVRFNAATGFRVPTFNDRYWQPGGNPGLKPERSASMDGGILLDGRTLRVDLSAFASRYTDQIVWMAGADHWSPTNISRTTSRGIEAALDIRAYEPLSTGIVYVLTRAVDRSDPSAPSFGRQLRYVPKHQAKAYASLQVGPARIDANARYVGRRYVTGDESEHLRANVVVDAQASVQQHVGIVSARLSVVVENVFDARYAVLQGYPMPPRHARLRLLLETR